MKKGNSLLRAGVIGTVVVALCCFTPVLVILLGVVGLSAVTGYLDFVLFPVLFFFACLTGYAVYRKNQREN
jgi:mercuric ion transport protein